MKFRLPTVASFLLPWAVGFGIFFVFSPSPLIARAHNCPRGSTPVEDVGTGKISCERVDRLDTESIGSKAEKSTVPGAPQRPGSPGAPKSPPAPESPRKMTSKEPNCGLSRWGCEQSCQRTYLSDATGVSPRSAQRAKVALSACLRICAKEFACPIQEPKTP